MISQATINAIGLKYNLLKPELGYGFSKSIHHDIAYVNLIIMYAISFFEISSHLIKKSIYAYDR